MAAPEESPSDMRSTSSSPFVLLLLLVGTDAFTHSHHSTGWRHSASKRQSVSPQRRDVVRAVLAEPKADMKVTVLAGDGIGPEITAATLSVLEKLAELKKGEISFTFDHALIGGAALDATDDPFPPATLASCQAADSVLLACIGGPKWDGNTREKRPESGLLAMRKLMNLFANLRPAKVLPQLVDASTLKPEIVEGVDIMVVRELTGDVYFGEPKGISTDAATGERTGFNNMIYSESEIERIAKVAYEVATKRRGEVCSIDKANVLDVSQLWREKVIEVGKNYPDVSLSHMYVDNAAMQLIRWPKQVGTDFEGGRHTLASENKAKI